MKLSVKWFWLLKFCGSLNCDPTRNATTCFRRASPIPTHCHPNNVKGHSQPIACYRNGGATPTGTEGRLPQPAIGREGGLPCNPQPATGRKGRLPTHSLLQEGRGDFQPTACHRKGEDIARPSIVCMYRSLPPRVKGSVLKLL